MPKTADINFTDNMLKEMKRKQSVNLLDQVSNGLYREKADNEEQWTPELEAAWIVVRKEICDRLAGER